MFTRTFGSVMGPEMVSGIVLPPSFRYGISAFRLSLPGTPSTMLPAKGQGADRRFLAVKLVVRDLEEAEGIPAHAMTLKEKFQSADALLISTPEYNTSLPAVLKNAIDWISRPVPGVPWLAGISGQVLGGMSASPGGTGGMQALAHLRTIPLRRGGGCAGPLSAVTVAVPGGGA